MNTKFLILVGAGSTLSDAKNFPLLKRPPLDKGFFDVAYRTQTEGFTTIHRYLKNVYDFDPTESHQDSLEKVMAILYADIHNPQLETEAVTAFRALIRLLNRRIAETTNELNPSNRFNLYKILGQMLDNDYKPNEICIITFNQDLHIEKVLEKLQDTSRSKRYGRIFNFPYCYGIVDAQSRISKPRRTLGNFATGDPDDPILRILKLHGSLNWFSVYDTKNITRNTILNNSRAYRITPRRHISPELMFTPLGCRRKYTFPLVIPPVTHKAGILHQDIQPLWSKAETALKNAEKIVVFGYSCPDSDFESANLLRRTIQKNTNLREFHIIDPNPSVFQRYVDITQFDGLHYFKSVDAYVRHAGFHMS